MTAASSALHGFQAGWRAWPRRLPAQDALPPTMADGRPWPRISIVTPTLNQGPYIEDCILSVLHQGYPDVEHVIWDGGSTDGTGAILDRYESRLARVVREPDEGQSDAINKAMALTSGGIVTWLNSDDMLAPGALAAVARAFAASGADMVAGACSTLYGAAPAFHHLPSVADGPLPLADLVDMEAAWLQGRFFYQPEVMFTRALWERAGGAVRKDLHLSMDYDMWVRFAEVGATIHTIGQPICIFRHQPDQKTAVKETFMPELLREAEAARQRNAITVTSTPPASRLGRNLRIVTVHRAPPEVSVSALSRMAEACQEAWAEVFPLHLTTGGDPAEAPVGTWMDRIVSRVAWQGPDLVLVEDLRVMPAAEDLLARLAERWPTMAFQDGPGWPSARPAALLDLVDLRRMAPSAPREALLAPLDRAVARHAERLPGEAFCVLVLGAAGHPEAAAAIAAAAPGLTLRHDLRSGPERLFQLAAFDAVVALTATAEAKQVLAEAAACGAIPLAVEETALDRLPGWPVAACSSAGAVAERLAALAGDRAATAWMAVHVRQAAAAQLSPFAAYRGLFLRWRELGLLHRLGAKDKIDFRPLPQPLRASLPSWPGL